MYFNVYSQIYSTHAAAMVFQTCVLLNNCILLFSVLMVISLSGGLNLNLRCPVGTYSNVSGATDLSTCVSCPKGTYQPIEAVAGGVVTCSWISGTVQGLLTRQLPS